MSIGVASPATVALPEPLFSPAFINNEEVPASPPSSRSMQASHERLKELRRSASRSPTKLPSLSDIAARLKVDRELVAEDGAPLSPTKSSSAEGRPRLGITGRLIPTSSSTTASGPSGDALKSGPSVLGPSSPSKLNASGQISRSELPSGSSSPTKRFSAPGLPSLEEIRDRMAKKGLTIPGKENIAAAADSEQQPSALQSHLSSAAAETKKKRQSPPPAIIIPGNDALDRGSVLIKDESIMRLGISRPHMAAMPISPNRANAYEPTKPERTILRPGTGSLPPTPSSAVSGFAPSAPSPQTKSYPLQHLWTMYFDSKTFNPSTFVPTPTAPTFSENGQGLLSPLPATPTASGASWEANLKCLGAYRTVEAFFGTFKTLRRPSQLEKSSNYHIFKDGIKPMWEDPCNAEGGKWTLTFKQNNPALLDRSWMWLVLGLVGEELDEFDEVTGAVCSLRPRGDRLALWLRSKSNVDRVNQIGRRLLRILELETEPGVTLEFSSNTGAPLEGPARYISVQNPMTPGSASSGSSAPSLSGQRRPSFQQQTGGPIGLLGSANGPNPFQQPQRSPQPQQTSMLQHQQHTPMSSSVGRFGGPSPSRSPEQREGRSVPLNPSPSSLGSSLGVHLNSPVGHLPSDGGSAFGSQRGQGGGGSRFGPPTGASSGLLNRGPFGRTSSDRSPLNPNLPMRV